MTSVARLVLFVQDRDDIPAQGEHMKKPLEEPKERQVIFHGLDTQEKKISSSLSH